MRLDRIEREEEVLIDVISCDHQPDLNDTSFACQTVDVSEAGMKVVSDIPIPVSTRLSLRLDLSTALYRLEGEVRWSIDESSHFVGLLLDDDCQDYIAWTKMFQIDF